MCLAWSKSHKHPEFKDKTIFEVYNGLKNLDKKIGSYVSQ
jgi:hypothetical protein